jgi:hypothetical protein
LHKVQVQVSLFPPFVLRRCILDLCGRRGRSTPELHKDDYTAVLIHGVQVCEPRPAANANLSKPFSCERVLNALRTSEVDLKSICTCAEDNEAEKAGKIALEKERAQGRAVAMEVDTREDAKEGTEETEEIDDETEEGFAARGRTEMEKADVHIQLVEAADSDTQSDTDVANEHASDDGKEDR